MATKDEICKLREDLWEVALRLHDLELGNLALTIVKAENVIKNLTKIPSEEELYWFIRDHGLGIVPLLQRFCSMQQKVIML